MATLRAPRDAPCRQHRLSSNSTLEGAAGADFDEHRWARCAARSPSLPSAAILPNGRRGESRCNARLPRGGRKTSKDAFGRPPLPMPVQWRPSITPLQLTTATPRRGLAGNLQALRPLLGVAWQCAAPLDPAPQSSSRPRPHHAATMPRGTVANGMPNPQTRSTQRSTKKQQALCEWPELHSRAAIRRELNLSLGQA